MKPSYHIFKLDLSLNVSYLYTKFGVNRIKRAAKKIVVFNKVCYKNYIPFKNHEIYRKFQKIGSWVLRVLTLLGDYTQRQRFSS